MKKKGRYTKKNINMITNNNNSIDTLREDDSSNGNIILLNSDNTIDLNNVITVDKTSDVEDDDPTPFEDMELEKNSYCQMKVEAQRWTVFNFFCA